MRQSLFTSRDGASKRGTSALGKRIKWGGVLVWLIVADHLPADDVPAGDKTSTAEQITAGHELFVREWKIDDPRSVSGDGLGPMYNAASCAKCHRLGGLGGAGTNDDNVDLLTVKVPRKVVVAGGDLTRRVAAFHPALAAGRLSATTVLHRFSPDPNYDAWRGRFLTAGPPAQLPVARIVAVTTAASKHPLKATNPVQQLDGMAYQRSQRNTPALFGAGLIDLLPDWAFDEMQQRQAEKKGGVSGRVPRTASGKAGRFGWRGQTENLQEFVLGACAVELGLEAPGHLQPLEPLQVTLDGGGRPHSPLRHGLDISEEQCKALTQFVAHLPPPRQWPATEDAAVETAVRGEKQFEKIGCADCHVRQVAYINAIYSDLLLHDMGEGLEDPVPANPEQGSIGSASYYGGADSLLAKVSPDERREWRTPPLWGVRDSGPYLHDGRAQTFAEAIAWHGGEATRSARYFRRLSKDEKEDLLAFLNCLAAPAPESLALENVALVVDQ